MDTQTNSTSGSLAEEDTRETILLGIDGTAEIFDGAYAKSMAPSFVKRIIDMAPWPMKHYIRGPGGDGLDMFSLISAGYEFVRLNTFRKPNTKVLLTGYSRGGAAVVGVAKKLKHEGIMIDAMILFDPVNRSQTSETDDVPNNVLNMVQARRATRTYSRISFNNCATIWHSPTKCEIGHFWATHGGVGGVPWQLEFGDRPTDYISEGISEHLLSGVVYSPGSMGVSAATSLATTFNFRTNWHQPRDYEGSLPELLLARVKAGGHTQVTFEEDRRGAEACWAWIAPRVRRYGFIGGR